MVIYFLSFSLLQLISAEERTTIETATVSFFSRVIACHVPNQMLFAKVLCDVIKEQGIASKAGRWRNRDSKTMTENEIAS